MFVSFSHTQFNLYTPLYIFLGIALLGVLYSVFVLPETKVREDFPFDWKRINPLRSIALLKRNRLSLGLVLIFIPYIFSEEGMFDTLILFIKYQFSLDPQDLGTLLAVAGFCYLVAQGVVL